MKRVRLAWRLALGEGCQERGLVSLELDLCGMRAGIAWATPSLFRPHLGKQNHVADAAGCRSAASPAGRCRCLRPRWAAARTRARGRSRRRRTWPLRRRPPSASACSRKRSAWSSGSFSSEKPLAISRPAMNSSKRSVTAGFASLRRASGETSVGCATMKVGCDQLRSVVCSNSLSCSSRRCRRVGSDLRRRTAPAPRADTAVFCSSCSG